MTLQRILDQPGGSDKRVIAVMSRKLTVVVGSSTLKAHGKSHQPIATHQYNISLCRQQCPSLKPWLLQH